MFPTATPSWRPKLPGGLGGAVVSGPLGLVAAFPSSSLGCFHKRKGVGTSAPPRGLTHQSLAAVSDLEGHCEKPLVVQVTSWPEVLYAHCFLVNSCFLIGKPNLPLRFLNISF